MARERSSLSMVTSKPRSCWKPCRTIGAPSALAGLLIHSGYALRELAVELHAERMVQWIDGASSARRSASRAHVVVESALAIAGRSLLVIGWAADPPNDIRTAKLRSAERVIDVTGFTGAGAAAWTFPAVSISGAACVGVLLPRR